MVIFFLASENVRQGRAKVKFFIDVKPPDHFIFSVKSTDLRRKNYLIAWSASKLWTPQKMTFKCPWYLALWRGQLLKRTVFETTRFLSELTER